MMWHANYVTSFKALSFLIKVLFLTTFNFYFAEFVRRTFLVSGVTKTFKLFFRLERTMSQATCTKLSLAYLRLLVLPLFLQETAPGP